MKTKVGCVFFLVLLITILSPSYAQSGLAGTWAGKEGEGKDAVAWSMELAAKGNVLTGTRTVTFTGGQQKCEIADGKVEGRLFSFKCELTGPRGDNPFTATFEGFVNSKGNEITISPQKPASGGPVTLMRK